MYILVFHLKMYLDTNAFLHKITFSIDPIISTEL